MAKKKTTKEVKVEEVVSIDKETTSKPKKGTVSKDTIKTDRLPEKDFPMLLAGMTVTSVEVKEDDLSLYFSPLYKLVINADGWEVVKL